MKTENHLRFFTLVLFYRLRFIVVSTLVVTAAAAVMCVLWPAEYETEGSILVKSKQLPENPGSAINPAAARTTLPPEDDDVALETRLITDVRLIAEALRSLKADGIYVDDRGSVIPLRAIAVLLRQLFPSRADSASPLLSEEELIARDIKDKLKAVVFPGSRIIDIRLRLRDPAAAWKLLERMLDIYPQFRVGVFSDQSMYDFYTQQTNAYREDMARYRERLLKTLRENNVSHAAAELDAQMALLNQMILELERHQNERAKIERRIEYLTRVQKRYAEAQQGMAVQLPPPVDYERPSDGGTETRSLMMSLYVELKRYSPGSAHYRDLLDRITAELASLIEYERDMRASLTALIERKQAQIARLKAQAARLKEVQVELDGIETDAALAKRSYETFAARHEEIKIEQGSAVPQLAAVQVLSRPSMPLEPAFPRPAVVIPLSVLTGLLLAFSLAWIQEYFDHTFKTPAQVESLLGVPVIGSLPEKK